MAELILAKWLPVLCTTSVPFEFLKCWSKSADLFRGLYHWPLFHWVVLIPYFFATTIITMYGLHRGWLVYVYFRHRHNAPRRPPDPAEWPKVTVQLPIFNEKYVIERLVDAVAKFDYPRDRLEIQVLDDSTDETQEIARACVERHQGVGLPIRYLHRSNRTGFKAGALAAGLESAVGELIALFDADFVPTSDFLRRTVPYFADPQIGMVQARWTYLNRGYSLLTKVQAMILDTYFGMEHFCRSRSGVFFNFTGTAGVWRRTAVRDAGGWQCDTLTEDIDLSYRAQLCGWRLLYLVDVECPSELPVEMNGFKEQQARWAKGSTQVGLKILPRLLRSKVTPRIKAEAFLHLTGAISCPFAFVLAGLLLPMMIVRLHRPELRSVLIDMPCVVSTFAVVAFLLTSQHVIYPRAWKRSIVYLPVLFAVFFAMSLRISRAVFEALLGIQSDFVRTPKFNVDGRSRSWHAKKYRSRGGWLPYLEIGCAGYFAFTLIYAIHNQVYRVAPFLLICVWGLVYMGVMSIMQGRGGLRAGPRSTLLLSDDLPIRLEVQNASDAPRKVDQETVPGD